jgi:hypothetical protein
MKKKEHKNKALYLKYAEVTREDISLSSFFQMNYAGAIALAIVGNVSWLFMQSLPKIPLIEGGTRTNKIYTPYVKAIHDAYVPTDKYTVNSNTYKTGKLEVNPNPGFRAHGTWLANLLFSLLILVGSAYYFKSCKSDLDTIDMMVDLKELKGKYRLNDAQAAKLITMSDDIISNMSAEERVYFDMLMDGNIKIKDDKVFKDMAVAILDGYLSTHPKETKALLTVFNTEITEELKKKIAIRSR